MRVGIIGTGRIAKRAVKEMLQVDAIVPAAVFNPNEEHAVEFACWAWEMFGSVPAANGYSREYSGKMLSEPLSAFGSVQEFAEAVDIVYIATPHGTHYEYARQMLEAGRHVICEKPMAFERLQAEELYSLAKSRSLVLMEGIKTAYCPGFKKIEEVATSGIIGDVVDVEAAFTRLTDPGCREFDDLLYGGSFTEFGTYTMLPIFRFLGAGYSGISFMSVPAATGIDGYTKAVFSYKKDGVAFATATAKTGLTAKSEGQLLITGTKGYILVPSPWWLTKYFEVRFEDPSGIERYECEFEGDGLRYEFREFVRRIREGVPDPGSGTGDRQLFSREEQEALARARVYERFLKERRR